MDQDEKLQVFYAPLPEEAASSSAASEYSKRAAVALSPLDAIVPCLLPDNFDLVCKSSTESGKKSLVVFVISCGADGSVHRNVRKFLRSMKKPSSGNDAAHGLVLLGHARCDNSAKQMRDTIFGTGKRLDKALECAMHKTCERCDTQAELEGPEDVFDPWVQGLLVHLKDD